MPCIHAIGCYGHLSTHSFQAPDTDTNLATLVPPKNHSDRATCVVAMPRLVEASTTSAFKMVPKEATVSQLAVIPPIPRTRIILWTTSCSKRKQKTTTTSDPWVSSTSLWGQIGASSPAPQSPRQGIPQSYLPRISIPNKPNKQTNKHTHTHTNKQYIIYHKQYIYNISQ